MEAMDFMDPRRRLRHNVMLIIGYVLVAIALLLLTTILIFVAYGFGLKNGQVVQSGLLFMSSTPNPAQIYIDGVRYKSDTNTKVVLPEGTYQFDLKRAGYRDWQRSISVVGGTVESFSYPFLVATSLTTSTVRAYETAPALLTESGDQHWLLISRPGLLSSFDVYDLTDIKKAPTLLSLPVGLLTSSTEQQSLTVVAWANDNDHVLIKHTYGTNAEYLLVKRSAPEQSLNLTKTLTLPTVGIDMRLSNEQYDHYFVLNGATHDLSRVALGGQAAQLYIKGVLSFATYSDNTVVYATADPADATKADIDLYDGGATYVIRRDKASPTYLLDIASYSGDLYIAAAPSAGNLAYVYKNPVDQLTNQRLGVTIPVQVFSIKNPNFVSFSPDGQYVVFENGTKFVSYDADNDANFTFTMPDTLDAPQSHASWMDGARLAYASKGQAVIFDYDGQNRQALVAADPHYDLVFDQSYKVMLTLVPSASNPVNELLTSTPLRTPADQ